MGRDMAELLRFSRHGGAHYAAGAVLSVHYYPGWASGAQRRCTLRAQRTNGAVPILSFLWGVAMPCGAWALGVSELVCCCLSRVALDRWGLRP